MAIKSKNNKKSKNDAALAAFSPSENMPAADEKTDMLINAKPQKMQAEGVLAPPASNKQLPDKHAVPQGKPLFVDADFEPATANTAAKKHGRKSKKLFAVLISLVILLIFSLGSLLFGKSSYARIKLDVNDYYNSVEFQQQIFNLAYGTYWLMQAEQQPELDIYEDAFELFFPSYKKTISMRHTKTITSELIDDLSQAFYTALISSLNLIETYDSGLIFSATDTESIYFYNDDGSPLSQIAKGASEKDFNISSLYAFFIIMEFNSNGALNISAQTGFEDFLSEEAAIKTLLRNVLNHCSESTIEKIKETGLEDFLVPPRNMRIVFAVPVGEQNLPRTFFLRETQLLVNSGFLLLGLALLAASALAGLIAAAVKPLGLRRLRITKMPLEFSLIFSAFAVVAFLLLLESGFFVQAYAGTLLNPLVWLGLNRSAAASLSLLCAFFVFFILYSAVYFAFASLTQPADIGFKQYFLRRCLLVRLFIVCRRGLALLFTWASTLNMHEKSSKTLLRIIIINLLAISVFCCFWFIGIAGGLIYSVALFIFWHKRLAKLKNDYNKTLSAAKQMAEGSLDVALSEDCGIFEELKNELMQINSGFKAAVNAETKSQKMKTELVTNVSHDLKTPLTAIITYVDLLKNEDISAEERAQYVDTLDMKSQKLKSLIDDLFEISRAGSNNLPLNKSNVDLPALLKQVAAENADELEKAGLELRISFAEEKQEILLDGERTSRIFENLLLNAAKYSLAGTRVYINGGKQHNNYKVEIKNISKQSPDFDLAHISERFVRGDEARSSEGSGLGLAIAKSFSELQGGSFEIKTDGDLFKAIITFPLSHENPS